jgi:hypothetical protein
VVQGCDRSGTRLSLKLFRLPEPRAEKTMEISSTRRPSDPMPTSGRSSVPLCPERPLRLRNRGVRPLTAPATGFNLVTPASSP